MPRMSEHEDYLKPYMVDNGDIIQLLDEGAFIKPDFPGFITAVFQIKSRLPNGQVKLWSMNKTTRNRCAAEWADDSENWVGKKLQLEIVRQNVRGTIREVIFGTPVDEPTQPVYTE